MSELQDMSDAELKALHLSTMSDDELKTAHEALPPMSWMDKAKDALKSLGTGVVHGAAGFVPDMRKNAQTLENVYRSKLDIPTLPVAPGGEEVNKGLDTQYGLHQPTTPYGQAAGRAGEFIGNPASYAMGPMGPAGMLAKGIGAGFAGAGSYAGEKGAESLVGPAGAPYGSLAGALAGGLLQPTTAIGQHADDVAKLSSEIGRKNLTAGDITGNKTLKAFESEISPRANEAQSQAFKQAAFNRVGENIGAPGERSITGEGGVIDTMMPRLGKNIDDVAKRNTMQADSALGNDLVDVQRQYSQHVAPTMRVPVVDNLIKDIGDKFPGYGGVLPGDVYTSLRSDARAQARNATDGHAKAALNGIADALDNAMERSVLKNNPTDAGKFSKAYKDYKNGLILQDWAGAGEQNMTPATLAASAKRLAGKNNYTRGRSDFDDLAESGRRVLTQFPDSGTARRGVAESTAKGLGLTIGGMAGLGAGQYANSQMSGKEDPVVPLLLGEGALGALIGRPALRGATMNPISQALLAKGLTPGGPSSTERLARALAQSQSARQANQ